MNQEFIKKLRSHLNISLDTAIKLFDKCGTDLTLCEQYYHQLQLEAIIHSTDCDEIIAKKYYQKYQGNIEKAIKAINETVKQLRIDENTHPNHPSGIILDGLDRELEFIAKPIRIFIYNDDFDCVADCFESVFPIKDKNCYGHDFERFDYCGLQIFDEDEARRIIKNIQNKSFADKKQQQFAERLIDWITQTLTHCKYIWVEGTL
ncbi:MAG: hypothetical protein Q3971_02460 [Moraxella sp.]|nr:hypothetical protein [Moraxella sp.]